MGGYTNNGNLISKSQNNALNSTLICVVYSSEPAVVQVQVLKTTV